MEDLSSIEQRLQDLYADEIEPDAALEPAIEELQTGARRIAGLIDVFAFTIGRLWHALLLMLGADPRAELGQTVGKPGQDQTREADE